MAGMNLPGRELTQCEGGRGASSMEHLQPRCAVGAERLLRHGTRDSGRDVNEEFGSATRRKPLEGLWQGSGMTCFTC